MSLEKEVTQNSEPIKDTITQEEKPKLSTAEGRREYQRRYYQLHKEQAKEYQKQYNKTHKRKREDSTSTTYHGRGRNADFVAPREVIKTSFNSVDIQQLYPEKMVNILSKVRKGTATYSGVGKGTGLITPKKYLPTVVKPTTIIDN
jgi:hypothetical protein